MNRKIVLLLLIATLLVSAAGCGAASELAKLAEGATTELTKGSLTASPKSAEPVVATPAVAPVVAKVDDVDKFNAYIDVCDVLTDRMTLCLEGYDERISPLDKDYAVDKKDFDGWINSIGSYERDKLNESFGFAAMEPKQEPVDGKYQALHPVAVEVLGALEKAYKYYDTKGYVDDKFAEGENIHKQLVAGLEKYFELRGEFIDAVGAMSHERTLKSLEEYKADGRVILYWGNVFMLDAEEVLNFMDTVEIKDGAAKIDAAEMRAVYDRLAASHKEFTAVADGEAAKKEGIRILFSSYESAVDAFKAEAADVMQKVEAKKKVSESDIEDLYDKYSDMIDDYNRML